MLLLVLAISSLLATAAQASHGGGAYWPYHGSAATGAVISEYGPAYSLAANPIVVPDIPARAVIGPSEGPVLVQGPQQGSAAVIGPSEGSVLVQGPRQGSAAVIGPSEGSVLVQGPRQGSATVIGPSEGGATIIGPQAGAATIVGPTDGGASVIGPQAGGATIIGPQAAGATIIGPSAGSPAKIITGGTTIVGPHVHLEDAHAHAYAEAHAHAHNTIYQPPPPPPPQTVYIKEVIREPTYVHHHHPHLYDAHEHKVICAPPANGLSTSAAVETIARTGSRYGPVHVGSALGRPVVTLSGPPIIGLARPLSINGPYVTGLGSSSSSASASSYASASSSSSSSSSSSDYAGRKFWYPAPAWIKC